MVNLSFTSNAQIKGTYVNSDEPNKEMFFDRETFVVRYNDYQKALPLYYCSDTIAYGHWTKVKDLQFLELSSDDTQCKSLIKISVKERKDGEARKLNFIIKNPIESHQKNIIEYSLDVRSNCSEFQGDLISQRFQVNEFSIQIPKDCSISSFSIYVYPVDFTRGWQDQYPNVIHSYTYEIKQNESNVFEIDLSKLTYCYMNAMKLKQDYVRIENKGLIRWDGQLYKRKK